MDSKVFTKYTRIAYVTKGYLKAKNSKLGLDDRCLLAYCKICGKILLEEHAIVRGKGGQKRTAYYCLRCAYRVFPKRTLDSIISKYVV